MIAQDFRYVAPSSLDEVFAALSEEGAKLLAGGMSLIPVMKLRLAAPSILIDLGRVPGLKGIRQDGGRLRIGGMTTHFEVESSALIRSHCPLLGLTAAAIGDVQVRNLGTVGGSVAHADPAADYPASLQALDAGIVLARMGGQRRVAAADFFVDTFTTAMEPGEIVIEVDVPADAAKAGVHYEKVAQPASGFAIVGIAARVVMNGSTVASAQVGVTGLAGKSFRAASVESALAGTAGSDGDIRNAAATVVAGVDANADLFASAKYRKHLAAVHTARALSAAVAAAR